MTGLNQARGFMAVSPFFATVRKHDPQRHSSVLPVLTSSGNLLAGATTRVAVGFVLNPFSVLKARYEVSTTFSHIRCMPFNTRQFSHRVIYTRIAH